MDPKIQKIQNITVNIGKIITLMLEFCAQPLRPVWLMYVQKEELQKDIQFRGIKNLSGFKGFTSDYKS